jgi:hypothetical protein
MPTRNANIDLRIEELILHDLPYDQRHRVAAAIEQELTRLLAERGAPPGFADEAPQFDAGTVHVSPNLTAESVGIQVAGSIYGKLAVGGSVPGAAQPPVIGGLS